MITPYHGQCDTVAARCLALVERYAPALMKAGGGGLEQARPLAGRRLSWHARQRIVTYRKNGKPVTEIAEICGVSQATVSKICRKAGIATRRRVWCLSPQVVARMHELRRQGLTFQSIAESVGCSVSAVHRHAPRAA